ncbi:MAG: N-acetyltransferase [Candidatus Lokiarchaeota archaeon]|nr:N-acetyltransferase [Candidatus Lokiarchaeota archaeon]
MKKVFQLKNGEKIILRHVSEADIEGIWHNFNEVVEEGIYLPVFFPVRSEYEKQSWYNHLLQEKELCVVAVLPEFKSPLNIIGQCEVSNLEWDAANHVGRLGIIIQQKYRDLGIGLHLIDLAIRESKKLNDKEKIILSCFSNNTRALSLYKKVGFKTVGIRKNQFFMDANYYDEVLMELWIDDYIHQHPDSNPK